MEALLTYEYKKWGFEEVLFSGLRVKGKMVSSREHEWTDFGS